jgi:hypothetical protein
MNQSVMDPEGGKPMAGEKGRIPWIVVVALLVIALGIIAVTFRYKMTVIDGTVLVLERWTGRLTLVHKDGSISRLEKGKEGKAPGSRSGFGAGFSSGFKLSNLFKAGARAPGAAVKTGTKTIKGAGDKIVKASDGKTVSRPAREAKKTGTQVKSGADTAVSQAQKPTPRVSPFGSGTTTSKDLWETGAKAYSSIKWQGEQGYFEMAIRPYTDEVKKLRKEKKSAVHIDLVDAKGAIVMCLTIPVHDMKAVRDEKNKITGFEYSNSIPIGRTDFQSIWDWKIRQKV